MPLERLTQALVDEIAREYPVLSNLNLSKNAMRVIDCDLSCLPYVRRLNLSHNQLTALPPTLATQLPQLDELLLSHNCMYVRRAFFSYVLRLLHCAGTNFLSQSILGIPALLEIAEKTGPRCQPPRSL
jgi:hypothetical protein